MCFYPPCLAMYRAFLILCVRCLCAVLGLCVCECVFVPYRSAVFGIVPEVLRILANWVSFESSLHLSTRPSRVYEYILRSRRDHRQAVASATASFMRHLHAGTPACQDHQAHRRATSQQRAIQQPPHRTAPRRQRAGL